MSGSTCASSHASRALSTASLMVVMTPLVGESNPNRCLFFSKNSATLILRCCFASSSASTMRFHLGYRRGRIKRLLPARVKILERDLAGFGFPCTDHDCKIRRLRCVCHLSPKPALHKIHLRPDPFGPECPGHGECEAAPLACADDPDNGIFFGLHIAQRDHHPVKPDGKTHGSDVVAAKQVREPVRPAANDLVLSAKIVGKPFKDHAGIVVEPSGDPEVEGITDTGSIEDPG